MVIVNASGENGMGNQLQSMLEILLERLHYELVDLEYAPDGLVRVFIDKPDGVSISDCVKVSDHLTRFFTVEGINYDRLEVSSPGLDRPLKKITDFARFKGYQATIQLQRPIDPLSNQRRFSGNIVEAQNDTVQLEIDGEILAFPLELINKARLVPKF